MQFDAIVNLLWRLRRIRKRGRAVRAGGEPGIDDAIWVWMERVARARPAFARRAIGARLFFLTLQWRFGRVAGGGGRVNAPFRASNAAMRVSCAAILSRVPASAANNVAIGVSVSAWLKVLRSGGGVTRCLESIWTQSCQKI